MLGFLAVIVMSSLRKLKHTAKYYKSVWLSRGKSDAYVNLSWWIPVPISCFVSPTAIFMAITLHTLPPTPTRINTAPMEESAHVKGLEERKIGHMSKDDQTLAKLGYKSEFKREFGYFGTLSFAFSVVGLSSCVTSTFNTPFNSAGPAAVIWCWVIGSVMCMTMAASVAELVSAFPTSGGLYSASAFLVPKRYKAPVGFLVGWLSILGQIAGVASAEFALSQMIWSAYSISQTGNYSASKLQIVGVFGVLLLIHGLMNSVATSIMAKLTRSFIFFNFGATFTIILALGLSGPPRQTFQSVFTNIVNRSGWDSTPLAFMMGILSAEWVRNLESRSNSYALYLRILTLSDYDATAHISEEVKNPAVAAPFAIVTAVGVTGVLGWFLNLALVLYMPDLPSLTTSSATTSSLNNLGFMSNYTNDVFTNTTSILTSQSPPPSPSSSSDLLLVATILSQNLTPGLFYFTWALICINAFFQVNVVLQACSRTLFAFSRDGGLPDGHFFGKLNDWTKIPLRAVWVVILISLLFGSLDFVSTVAVNAIFRWASSSSFHSYLGNRFRWKRKIRNILWFIRGLYTETFIFIYRYHSLRTFLSSWAYKYLYNCPGFFVCHPDSHEDDFQKPPRRKPLRLFGTIQARAVQFGEWDSDVDDQLAGGIMGDIHLDNLGLPNGPSGLAWLNKSSFPANIYSSIITVTVVVFSCAWYYLHAFQWYKGPKSNL
ncbi:hypothetical protein VP01_173g8 [Puccinia sorghi]|uniref:Amino acid permease/ SLC12A domain-containing protein n=1 Tax=Puccinia sorghi TaxID=27349 RepID=A0A0L6VH29_9BASI|nr:hypothetical protein VP01_173g8 [Puccinia sorghi]